MCRGFAVDVEGFGGGDLHAVGELEAFDAGGELGLVGVGSPGGGGSGWRGGRAGAAGRWVGWSPGGDRDCRWDRLRV